MRRFSINQVYSSTPLIFFVRRDVSDSYQLDEPTGNWSIQQYETPSPFDNLLQNKISKNDIEDIASFEEEIFDFDLIKPKRKQNFLMVSKFIVETFKPKLFLDDFLSDEI